MDEARFCVQTPPEMAGIAGELRALRSEDRKPMTRTRFLELAEIAKGICDTLSKMGVKPWEGCEFRKIAERLWELG